jgi:hypothetical protein
MMSESRSSLSSPSSPSEAKVAEHVLCQSNSGVHAPSRQQPANNTSIADELTKFAKLREQWVLTEDEFERLSECSPP